MELPNTIAGENEAGTVEQRAEHRRRCLKSGVILFNSGYASYACQIRNMNESGVMVEMGETTGIPQTFDFRMDGVKKIPAEIIWRSKSRIGIRFTS